jgi:hypothetical protein
MKSPRCMPSPKSVPVLRPCAPGPLTGVVLQKTYTPKQFENVRIAGVAPAPGMATADQPADPALAPP